MGLTQSWILYEVDNVYQHYIKYIHLAGTAFFFCLSKIMTSTATKTMTTKVKMTAMDKAAADTLLTSLSLLQLMLMSLERELL